MSDYKFEIIGVLKVVPHKRKGTVKKPETIPFNSIEHEPVPVEIIRDKIASFNGLKS